jgi:hypothetical protein
MKKLLLIILVLSLSLLATEVMAQCSICTRTAAQLGERPARGLNAGILYLAAIPLSLVGVLAYRWWRNNGREEI